jgi:HEAT repeat protein
VVSAPSNKFEGVQEVAAHVLGLWGGRESVEALRQWLTKCLAREAGWAARSVAIKNLAGLVEAEDIDWVLDTYFGVKGQLLKHALLPLVVGLPVELARDRLLAGLRDPEWENRQAVIKAIGNMEFADRRVLLSALKNDPHPQVRKSAKLFCESTRIAASRSPP